MSCKRTARRPPEKLRVTLDSVAFGGDAVGRDDDGRVVFVPGGAPGDVVDAIVEEKKKGYVRTRLERLVRPGAARVEPPCPRYLEGCGGCQWQHIAIDAQRAAKGDIVRRALRHVATSFEAVAAPAPAFGWRRRARLRWRRGVLGYVERRSHRLIDVDACPQLEPALDAALAAVRAALLADLDGSGDVELLCTGRGEVHVVLSSPLASAHELVGRAAIVGVVAGGEVFGASRVDLADDAQPFWARADVFAQASAAGNALLRRLVLDAAGPLEGRRVLELFAGSGNFTRDLAARAAHVVAVEDAAPAVALAAENLAVRGLNAELRCEPAERSLAHGAYDLVVVDPPRTGLAPELSAALAAQTAPIIYISCDPNTLGRDLRLLGRRVERVVPLDLMPQTFHVEIVAVLAQT
jgi:23S rRNA (uracil1939-C5)-methyltransferase